MAAVAVSILESDPNWTDPDDALRELLEREHLILQMQETPGWALWKDFVAALAAGYQNRLLRGRHADLQEYKYDAGVVEGIRLALGASEDLRQRVAAQREILNMQLANQEEHDEPAVA